MTWIVWRQHRIQALIGAALLTALAILLLITGLQMATQYHSALAACTARVTGGDVPVTAVGAGGRRRAPWPGRQAQRPRRADPDDQLGPGPDPDRPRRPAGPVLPA